MWFSTMKGYTKVGHEAPLPNDTSLSLLHSLLGLCRGSSYRGLRYSVVLSASNDSWITHDVKCHNLWAV